MNRNSSFGRFTPTYICSLCGIRTRETGDGESGCEMCVDCFNLCSFDNQVNDSGEALPANEQAAMERRLENIAKKGGDAAKVRDFCAYLFPGDSSGSTRIDEQASEEFGI